MQRKVKGRSELGASTGAVGTGIGECRHDEYLAFQRPCGRKSFVDNGGEGFLFLSQTPEQQQQ